MSAFLLPLFSVLSLTAAAPKLNTELTTSQEKLFLDNFIQNYNDEIDRYVNAFLKDTAKEICEDEYTNLRIPYEEVVERIEEVSKGDFSSITVCTLVKTKLYYVAEPMVKAIDSCLPEKKNGIAEYFINGIISTFSQICEFSGEQILELTNPCMMHIDLEDNKCMQEVEDRWNSQATEDSSAKSYKQLMCSAYKDFRPCVEEAFADKCKLQITQTSIMTFLDSFFARPCVV